MLILLNTFFIILNGLKSQFFVLPKYTLHNTFPAASAVQGGAGRPEFPNLRLLHTDCPSRSSRPGTAPCSWLMTDDYAVAPSS